MKKAAIAGHLPEGTIVYAIKLDRKGNPTDQEIRGIVLSDCDCDKPDDAWHTYLVQFPRRRSFQYRMDLRAEGEVL